MKYWKAASNVIDKGALESVEHYNVAVPCFFCAMFVVCLDHSAQLSP